jgi:hypothetical protein
MIYLILAAIILSLIGYTFTLVKTIRIQNDIIIEQKDVIEGQKDTLLKEKINHKYTAQKLDFYYRGYVEAASKGFVQGRPSQIIIEDVQPIGSGEKGYTITEYDMDEILSEISKKGIKNVDNAKLEFLRKFGKNDTDKR